MSDGGRAKRAKARGRPRERGEAKERSSRPRVRAAADPAGHRVASVVTEAARPRAIERGRHSETSVKADGAEAAE